jgi:methylenetetrahydrofolate reductase (NADPH)
LRRALRLSYADGVRIDRMLARGRPTFSFEFFPPKTPAGEAALLETVLELRPLEPDFVSVTYGAMGSNRGQVIELVTKIKHEIGIEAMAHLSCTGHTREELAAVLDRFAAAGLDNVLALRGDPPKGETFRPVPGGFAHASDLAAMIRGRWDFCVGGAAYPEVHPDAPDAETDLANLATKVRAGADFLITQLFFSTQDYLDFVPRARAVGVGVPIIPGIMPITDVAQIKRMSTMCGAKMPPDLVARLEGADGDPAAVLKVGVAHAIEQCRELLARGAPGIHFYTLNKSPATRQVLSALRGG